MHDMFCRGWRVVGLLMITIAIAHCGDGNFNDNGGTPGATRTATGKTPTPVGITATPGAITPTGGGGGTGVPTSTASPSGSSCPSAISFLGDATTTRLDTGWTGLAHDAKIISGGEVTVSTDCGGRARPCGVCNLSGPIANPDNNQGISNNQRCSTDTSTECTSNGDCTAPGVCAFFFGPPLPLAAGGVSTCVTNQVVSTITGTANIETGESTNTTQLLSRVFTGPLLEQPCPTCDGDTTAGDGQRNGTCSGGARDGLSCDAGGVSVTFAPKGTTSFDCPPLSGGQIGALPINLSSTTAGVTRTLSNDSPGCRAAVGSKCFCDTCASAGAAPCSTNADCAGAVCGGLRCRGGTNSGNVCTTAGTSTECPGGACGVPGQSSAPNACDDGVCSATAADANNGECAGGPFDRFCVPHDTFRACSSDIDCTFAGDTCAGGKNRPCFLDNGAVGGAVTAPGRADVPVNGVAHPELGSLFCIAPTSSSAVNSAAGLPGLGRISLNGTATERH
jgi:hypothetical protein